MGGSQHGREAGKRRTVPRRRLGWRLGWRRSGTYPLSLAAPPRPALPPLHIPSLSPKPPRDPATLSSSPLSPSPGTWRPRRSIVFASWGAEEFGLIGSTEFTEVSEACGAGGGGIPEAGPGRAHVGPPPAGILQQAAGAHRGLHQRGHLGVWYGAGDGCADPGRGATKGRRPE